MTTLVLISLAALGVFCGQVRGQGRAFPIAAEEDIISRFQRFNPNIEYDRTNFLVDLAGHYAGCRNIGNNGFQDLTETTRLGDSIRGLLASTPGRETHVNAVVVYIQRVVSEWENSVEVIEQVRTAEAFGCSVRPGCSGRVSVACLFSPADAGQQAPPEISGPPARAFTPEQYVIAEGVLGQFWDRSHFLENLSGMETNCAMVEEDDWAFVRAREEGEKRGLIINGVFGNAYNSGSTQEGIMEVLRSFTKIRYAAEVGCSLIPDCKYGYGTDTQDMYVVVSCLYVE